MPKKRLLQGWPQRTDMTLKRTVFLCSVCYDSLPLYQLRQLFHDVGTDMKKRN